MKITLRAFLPLAMLMVVGITSASAEEKKFPSKPIELILSTSAGSGAARYGQMLADGASKILGVPVEPVYKPGGSSNESAVYLASKPADGYTVATWSMSRAGYMNLPGFKLDPHNFTYVMAMEKEVFAFAVPADSPFKTIEDLISYAKQNPGQVNVGSTRVGSIHHMLVTEFANAAGVKFSYIPYEGTNDALKDILGKDLQVGLIQPGLLLPHVKAGTVRILLVLNDKRLPALPDVRVPHDIGLDYPISQQLYGLMAPKGIPQDRMEILAKAFKAVMDTPEYQTYLQQNPHVVPDYMDSAQLTPLYDNALKEARSFMVANKIPVNNQQ